MCSAMRLSGQPLRLRFVFRSDVPRSRCCTWYCRHATRDRFVFINLSTFSRHIPTVSVVLSCTHMPIHAMHTPTSRHMTNKKWGEVGRQAVPRAQSGCRDERDASGRGQASLCATADAHDTGGYTRDAPRTPDVTDTPQRAVRPHTRRLSHTAHARPERGYCGTHGLGRAQSGRTCSRSSRT